MTIYKNRYLIVKSFFVLKSGAVDASLAFRVVLWSEVKVGGAWASPGVYLCTWFFMQNIWSPFWWFKCVSGPVLLASETFGSQPATTTTIVLPGKPRPDPPDHLHHPCSSSAVRTWWDPAPGLDEIWDQAAGRQWGGTEVNGGRVNGLWTGWGWAEGGHGPSVEEHVVQEQPSVPRCSVLLFPVGVEGPGEGAAAAEEAGGPWEEDSAGSDGQVRRFKNKIK